MAASEETIQGKTAIYVTKLGYNFWSDQKPGYPEDLHVHPKSYDIYLPKEDLHPISDMKAALARCEE